jgi:hypothetical protein
VMPVISVLKGVKTPNTLKGHEISPRSVSVEPKTGLVCLQRYAAKSSKGN